MHEITKQFRAEIAHRLQDHPGGCSNIHGHSYLFEVTVGGPIGKGNMVMDFSKLKDIVGCLLNEWDHALLLEDNDPLLEVLEEHTNVIEVPGAPTAENMAKMIAVYVQRRLPVFNESDCNVARVRVWETATSYADWVESC